MITFFSVDFSGVTNGFQLVEWSGLSDICRHNVDFTATPHHM